MLWDAGEEQTDDGTPRASRRRPDTVGVVASLLGVATMLSAVGVVAQTASFSGISVGDRVLQGALSTPYTAVLALAAALASGVATVGDGGRRAGPRIWSDRSVGVVALAASAAGAYAAFDVLGRHWGNSNPEDPGIAWRERLGMTAYVLSSVALGAVALWLLRSELFPRGEYGCGTSTDSVEHTNEAGARAPLRRAPDAAIAFLLIAVVALVGAAAHELLPWSGRSALRESSQALAGYERVGSIGSRFVGACLQFNAYPIAFATLVVAALVISARRSDGRRNVDAGRAVGILGGLAILAAIVSSGHALAASSNDPPDGALLLSRAARVGTIGAALSSAVVAVAACYLVRTVLDLEPADASSADRTRPRVPLRPVSGCLAAASLGFGAYIGAIVTDLHIPFATGDVLVEVGPFVLLGIGLALGAALVVFVTREASSRRDSWSSGVMWVTGVIACAALADAAFTALHVVAGSRGRNSLITASSTDQRIGYVALAVAIGFVALTALVLIWCESQPARFEPSGDDEIVFADLTP